MPSSAMSSAAMTPVDKFLDEQSDVDAGLDDKPTVDAGAEHVSGSVASGMTGSLIPAIFPVYAFI